MAWNSQVNVNDFLCHSTSTQLDNSSTQLDNSRSYRRIRAPCLILSLSYDTSARYVMCLCVYGSVAAVVVPSVRLSSSGCLAETRRGCYGCVGWRSQQSCGGMLLHVYTST